MAGIDDLLGDDPGKEAEKKAEQEFPIPLVTSAINYPTVYADGCLFATRLGSNVRLTFVETILEAGDSPSPGAKTRHVGTLVMPVEGFSNMLDYLNKISKEYILPGEATDGQ